MSLLSSTVRRTLATASVVGTLVAAAAIPGGTAYAASDQAKPPATCEFRPTPDRPAARPVDLPKAKQKSHGTVDVEIATNYGPMVFRLDRDLAPCAVGSLAHLAKADFYDASQCFRLTNSARLGVLQCGDIYRQEEGGPGYEFDDEVTPSLTYPRGTIAMGNQGPGTNGSEFFVVHSFANISPNYTVMGHLLSGFEALDAIVAAGIADTDLDGPPAQPVWITDVSVVGQRG
ncbi:MAG: peptidylprolyl isomerase [Knoellia sp.]